MLQISPLELLLRCIPESFLLIFVSYLFSYKKLNKRIWLISSVLLTVITYLVRLLPIHFGVHTIIVMMIYIVITVLINEIPINKAIFSILTAMIMLTMCELINLFILDKCLNINMKILLNKPLMKTLYFMPSLFLFGTIDLILYIFIYKSKKSIQKMFLSENL
jgi:hypothetical protein